jgi:uncharacterized protein (TIGR00369 family)
MRYKVKRKQPNSRMCLVCGLMNEFGLKSRFYELENNELVALFTPCEEHQSYPGRMHGGMISAILDETVGRAIMAFDHDFWGVTIELNVKYLKPVPLDEELMVVGRITKDSRRIFEGTSEIILQSGEVAAEAEGRYLKMPLDRIADFDFTDEWTVTPSPDDPVEIEIRRTGEAG